MTFNISLAQIDICLGDPQTNLEKASEVIREASHQGSDLVLLPELWSSGYDLPNWRDYATDLEKGIFQDIARLARENQIWVGGSSLEFSSGRAYNTFTLYGSDGECQGFYRKIHLFRLMDEDRWLAPGDRLQITSAPWAKMGLAVCYDLRFPEMFRKYALDDVGLILLCAEWPAARIAHWQTLLRSRAIENQVFIAAVNRVGMTNLEEFGGRSAVIDPWGEVVAEAGADETLLTCEIDLTMVKTVQEKIPVLSDRRPDVYC